MSIQLSILAFGPEPSMDNTSDLTEGLSISPCLALGLRVTL